MKRLQLLMGMPITVEILDASATEADIERVFAYFRSIDETFSASKEESEISKIDRGELPEEAYSDAVKTMLALSEQTRQETQGYFDIEHDVLIDPSGIVKGWAIFQVAQMLKEAGFVNFYIDAGGDIEVVGTNNGNPWRIGIRNPFNRTENVKVLAITDKGVATSGTAIRGQHVYNPHHSEKPIQDIVSLTVIGPNVYEADCFATAAFIQYTGDTIAQVGTNLNLRATIWDSAASGFPSTPTGSDTTIGDITKMWIEIDIYPAGSCMSGTPIT